MDSGSRDALQILIFLNRHIHFLKNKFFKNEKSTDVDSLLSPVRC